MDLTETQERITLHGLGFSQLKLGAGQRLHVWHPSLPRRDCFKSSQIHDHRFGFTSRILIGAMQNCVYRHDRTIRGSSLGTHSAYLHEGPRQATGNRPWTYDGEMKVEPAYTQELKAGDEYSMAPFVFHSTTPCGDGIVVTIMKKTIEVATHGAHSLCEIGITPDVEFDRKQWSELRLMEVTMLALAGMGPVND